MKLKDLESRIKKVVHQMPFDLCKLNWRGYYLLFIMNLSLATTIFSCRDFPKSGFYKLDKVIINQKKVDTIIIYINKPAEVLDFNFTDRESITNYALDGAILNNTTIEFKFCKDIKSDGLPKVFLTNDLEEDKVDLKIDITDSDLNYYGTELATVDEDDITKYTHGLEKYLNESIREHKKSETPIEPADESSEEITYGKKRARTDGSESEQESKRLKNEADCNTLKLGKYKIHDQNDDQKEVNIVIIGSDSKRKKKVSRFRGFLK